MLIYYCEFDAAIDRKQTDQNQCDKKKIPLAIVQTNRSIYSFEPDNIAEI